VFRLGPSLVSFSLDPDSKLFRIDDSAFSIWTSLLAIIMPISVIVAFDPYSRLFGIEGIPHQRLPASLTSIGRCCFGCVLLEPVQYSSNSIWRAPFDEKRFGI
jgi:hypothetical protein